MKAADCNHSGELSFAVLSHSHTSSKKEKRMEILGVWNHKLLTGLQYLGESFARRGGGVSFRLVPWRMREKWKGGSNSVGFIEKLYRWVQTVLTHYLGVKLQLSGNAEPESRWFTGQDWLGNKKIEIPFDLCQIFLIMSIFTFAAGLFPVLQ